MGIRRRLGTRSERDARTKRSAVKACLGSTTCAEGTGFRFYHDIRSTAYRFLRLQYNLHTLCESTSLPMIVFFFFCLIRSCFVSGINQTLRALRVSRHSKGGEERCCACCFDIGEMKYEPGKWKLGVWFPIARTSTFLFAGLVERFKCTVIMSGHVL